MYGKGWGRIQTVQDLFAQPRPPVEEIGREKQDAECLRSKIRRGESNHTQQVASFHQTRTLKNYIHPNPWELVVRHWQQQLVLWEQQRLMSRQ